MQAGLAAGNLETGIVAQVCAGIRLEFELAEIGSRPGRFGDMQFMLQHPLFQRRIGIDGDIAVAKAGESEIVRGIENEVGAMPAPCAAMADAGTGIAGVDTPADAVGPIVGIGFDHRLPHEHGAFAADDAIAIDLALVEVHLRKREQIADRLHDATGGIGMARQVAALREGHAMNAIDHMAGGDGGIHRIVGKQHGVSQFHRRENVFCHHGLKRVPCECLDDVTHEIEAGIVVRVEAAGLEPLGERMEFTHGLLVGIIAATIAGEAIAIETGGVAEQHPQGDGIANIIVTEAEIGNVVHHRRIEVEQALFHQPHHQCGGVHLGDGADEEEIVLAHGIAGIGIGESGHANGALAIANHAAGEADGIPAGGFSLHGGSEIAVRGTIGRPINHRWIDLGHERGGSLAL